MLSDYTSGLLQVSAAIRTYCGVSSGYQPDARVQRWLKRGHWRCVIVLLIDGMGSRIIEPRLDFGSFFRRNQLEEVKTVYPPTTSAATTAFLSGKSPKETGWLGWNQYFKEKDDQIILFREHSQYSDREYPGFIRQALPVNNIVDELNAKGIRADSAWPSFGHNPCADYPALMKKVLELSGQPDMRFVYAYWDELDSLMHAYGPSSKLTSLKLRQLNDLTERMARQLPKDTGLLILADHGQIDVQHYNLKADEELCSCLRLRPALEGRTTAFYVKPDKSAEFKRLFLRKLGDEFILMSHEEAASGSLFGLHQSHPRFEEFLGDWLALATGRTQLDYEKGGNLKGNHAGTLEAEMMIPIIVCPR
jgi:hypothetical protein